jgi:acylglycerol lipase
MTEHVDGTIAGTRARRLYWQAWKPADGEQVRAVVVMVHGVHEHGGRYEWVGRQLADCGFAGYVIDHAGHGRSDGRRGQIGRLSEVVRGVDRLVELASGRHPRTPVFLLGHSLGALVALEYVAGQPRHLSGLALSAVPLVPDAISPVQRVAARLMSAAAPNLKVVPLDSSEVSRDPDVVEYHRTNSLMVTGRLRARTAGEALASLNRMPARLGAVRVPVLVMTGTADKLANPAGSKLVMQGVGSPDRTLRTYPGLYHEILNEPEKDIVFADLAHWLTERL